MTACVGFLIVRAGREAEALATASNAATIDRTSYETLATSTSNRATVASDESYKISLYGGMQTLRLPSNPHELLEIDAHYLPLDYIVLSGNLLSHAGQAKYTQIGYDKYADFVQSSEFLDRFSFVTTLPNGAAVYRSIDLNQ
jgi:hypothetical protein